MIKRCILKLTFQMLGSDLLYLSAMSTPREDIFILTLTPTQADHSVSYTSVSCVQRPIKLTPQSNRSPSIRIVTRTTTGA